MDEAAYTLTVAETAARLGQDKRYVARLCASGRLRCRRAGPRLWLVDPVSVDAYRQSPARGWPRGTPRKRMDERAEGKSDAGR